MSCNIAVLGTTPETATLAVMYLRVRCFACPAFLLYNVGTGNFRGRKDTRTPLLAYMANNITYVLLVGVSFCTRKTLPTCTAPAYGHVCHCKLNLVQIHCFAREPVCHLCLTFP